MFYKVIVSHGNTEPIVTPKEIYDSAHNVFVSECRNAAGFLASRPADPVIVQLVKPDGEIEKSVTIAALQESTPTKQVLDFTKK